jgi:hypothetical protein
VALTAEQKAVLRRIKQIAAEVGASPKEVKAAIETGLVESNLRNLPGGDADSAGWRQERASLYKDPTNLDASIRRFFQETSAVKDKYGRAGDLAAAVQRPAAQYRGRYEQRSQEANTLLGASGLGGTASPTQVAQATKVVGGVDNSQVRRQLVAQYLTSDDQDPLDFALGIRAAQDVPGTRVKVPDAAAPQTKNTPLGGKSPLLELFYNGPGGVNVDNGKTVPQGFVSGHQDHVHVAAGPKTVIRLGRLAQQMGLTVRENPAFDKVDPVHTEGSYHYKNQAIDVSGDPAKMAAYSRAVARLYGLKR